MHGVTNARFTEDLSEEEDLVFVTGDFQDTIPRGNLLFEYEYMNTDHRPERPYFWAWIGGGMHLGEWINPKIIPLEMKGARGLFHVPRFESPGEGIAYRRRNKLTTNRDWKLLKMGGLLEQWKTQH
jgi:hypothetical protein